MKPCTYPSCTDPKASGQGQRYCTTHQHTQAEQQRIDSIQRLREWASSNPERAQTARRATARKWSGHPATKERRNREAKQFRVDNPREAWSLTLWDRFRITADDYDALLEAQGGHCALCPKTPDDQERRLHVDHDHRCCPTVGRCCGECIRGLLCAGCNRLLGWFENRRDQALEYADTRAFITPNPKEFEHGNR